MKPLVIHMIIFSNCSAIICHHVTNICTICSCTDCEFMFTSVMDWTQPAAKQQQSHLLPPSPRRWGREWEDQQWKKIHAMKYRKFNKESYLKVKLLRKGGTRRDDIFLVCVLWKTTYFKRRQQRWITPR